MKLIDFLTILDKHYQNITLIRFKDFNNYRNADERDTNTVEFTVGVGLGVTYEAQYTDSGMVILLKGKVDKILLFT